MAESYFVKKRAKILRRFDKAAEILRPLAAAKLGDEKTDAIISETRAEYEALLPKLPDPGKGASIYREFFGVAIMQHALYRVMKRHGHSPEETWELCEATLNQALARLPRWMKRISGWGLHFGFGKLQGRRMAKRSQKKSFGGFAFEFIEGQGEEFDFGVDYVGCGIDQFVRAEGDGEFAPYVCQSDIVASDAFGWGLTRTKTIAGGCTHCNFRFKRGGPTKVLRVGESEDGQAPAD